MSDPERLAAPGEFFVLPPASLPVWAHDVPHPIGDPDEDEELPGDDEDEDDDEEEDEEPMQV